MALNRDRLGMLALYVGLVALGVGLGVVWTAALTMSALPNIAPEAARGLTSTYQTLTYGAAAVFAGGLVGHLWSARHGGESGAAE